MVVRNIQEDNSISPVAFLDLNMYVIEAKGLKYMTLLADALRSVWLVGFGVGYQLGTVFNFLTVAG